MIFFKTVYGGFPLIATTRLPQEIPAAIRSRCVEIYFRGLNPEEIRIIGENAARKLGLPIDEKALDVLQKYATNGREAVNITQIAAGIVLNNSNHTVGQRQEITATEMEWVVQSGHYTPRPEKKIFTEPQVGVVNGLAVYGANLGMLLEIEVTVLPVSKEPGQLLSPNCGRRRNAGRRAPLRRKSMAKGSVENVLTVLRSTLKVDCHKYDIHVNFPGGIPTDGPSAGVAIATAIYSAITEIPIDHRVAMTGELSVRGYVKPVGGVAAKVNAARQAGAARVLIPEENWQSIFAETKDIEIIPVEKLEEVLEKALVYPAAKHDLPSSAPKVMNPAANFHLVCL